jgi:hypothetical protein
VFSTVWPEQAGPGGGEPQKGSQVSAGYLDVPIFSEVRHFVVVQNNSGNCICL